MEQHPIPRQITTFEFKLIGFMTLKQFIYLLIFGPTAFVVYSLFPIPLINIFLAVLVALFGVALAFLPINDRPLDVWIKNFIKRLNSPTQYVFRKDNKPLYFLDNLYFLSDPHKVMTHIESKEKLAAYLQKTQPAKTVSAKKKQIHSLLRTPTNQIVPPVQKEQPPEVAAVVESSPSVEVHVPTPEEHSTSIMPLMQVEESTNEVTPVVVHHAPAVEKKELPQVQIGQHPFFTGIVKNNRRIPLPGVLVYVKNEMNTPLRLLKTNPHGVFATYNPLPPGEYLFEVKDPNQGYFFDTMKVQVPRTDNKPYEFYSKEMM